MDIINIAHAGIISDAPTLASVGIKVLNFLLSVFGIVAIIMLVTSGIIYFFSAHNEKMMERAKRSLTYSVLGVISVMGAMVIVWTLSRFLK